MVKHLSTCGRLSMSSIITIKVRHENANLLAMEVL